MTVYGFTDRLAMSRGIVADTCVETIRTMLPGCIRVETTDVETDKSGIDYRAILRGGAEIGIDHKTRERGASQYWKGEPELALEKWSVIPTPGAPGTVGWTLDESKATDYTLHTFNPLDSLEAFLLPFQLLRVAFRHRIEHWWAAYFHAEQESQWGRARWCSECVFVPASVVMGAIREEMQHHQECPE